MSSEPEAPSSVPTPDLADRMRIALRKAGLTPGAMAKYLEVRGNTVSTWINGKVTPDARTLRLWALKTGAPYEWLRDGDDPSHRGGVLAGQKGSTVRAVDRRQAA